MTDNTYKAFYRKEQPTGLQVALLLLFAFLLAFVVLGISAWIIMLVLGALGSELGFTGPSYFVTFLAVWLVKTVAGWFKPNPTTNTKAN